MQTRRDMFEDWAKALGFSSGLLERAVSGDYIHPHTHYAWVGYEAGCQSYEGTNERRRVMHVLDDAGFRGLGLLGNIEKAIEWAASIQERYLKMVEGTGLEDARKDLLVVLGIADHMSEQLEHETSGLNGEETNACDTLHRIRGKHFSS